MTPKKFVAEDSKKANKGTTKEAENEMLNRGLKSTDAQNRSVRKLGCKNRLARLNGRTSRVTRG